VIVTCERCSTQFRLSDERIPETGVRVRCSRCKYAFHIERPARSEEERVQRAAARALEPDVPATTQDLPEEEQDWKFNDDGPFGDGTESLMQEAEDAPGAEMDSAPVGEASAGLGPGFGDLGGASAAGDSREGSGLELDNAPPQGGPPVSIHDAFSDSEGLHSEDSGLDLVGATVSRSASKPRRRAPPPEPARAAEELGKPEEWDFFADVPSKAVPSPGSTGPALIPARRPTSRVAPAELAAEESASRPAWLTTLGTALGWLAVAGLCLFGLHGGVALRAAGALPASQRLAHLQLEDLSSRFVENLVAGDLYVVSGTLRAEPGMPRAATGSLFAMLLDAHGERIKRPPIPVGPLPPDALLRQAPPEELQRIAAAARLPRPGASLRVAAVIPALPALARSVRFFTETPRGQEPSAEMLDEAAPQASVDSPADDVLAEIHLRESPILDAAADAL